MTLVLSLSAETTSVFAQQRNPRPNRRQNRFPDIQRGENPDIDAADPQLERRQGNRRQAVNQQIRQQIMQAIGLTPDQRLQMAEIRRSHDDEIISAGRRVREARRALDRAIMSEVYDDALINQHASVLAAAQTDMILLQTHIRSQVRSVLTTEQVRRFNDLEQRLRRQRRQQRQMRLKEGPPGIPGTPDDLGETDIVSLLLSIP